MTIIFLITSGPLGGHTDITKEIIVIKVMLVNSLIFVLYFGININKNLFVLLFIIKNKSKITTTISKNRENKK